MSVNFLDGDLIIGETVRLRSPVVLSSKLSITHGIVKKITDGRRGQTYNVAIGYEQDDLVELVRARLWKLSDYEYKKYMNSPQKSISSPTKSSTEIHEDRYKYASVAPLTPSKKTDNNASNAQVTLESNNDGERSYKVGSIAAEAGNSGKKQQTIPSKSTKDVVFTVESNSGSSAGFEYVPDLWFSTYTSIREDNDDDNEAERADESNNDDENDNDIIGQKRKCVSKGYNKGSDKVVSSELSNEVRNNRKNKAKESKPARAASNQKKGNFKDDGQLSSDSYDSDSSDNSDDIKSSNSLTGKVVVGEKVMLKAPPGAQDKCGIVKAIIDGRRAVNYKIETKTTIQILPRSGFWKISVAKKIKKSSVASASYSDCSNIVNCKAPAFMSIMRKQQQMLRKGVK